MQCFISGNVAKAASLIAAKSDVRKWLECIYVEPHPHGGVTVYASNGHAAIAIRDEEGRARGVVAFTVPVQAVPTGRRMKVSPIRICLMDDGTLKSGEIGENPTLAGPDGDAMYFYASPMPAALTSIPKSALKENTIEGAIAKIKELIERTHAECASSDPVPAEGCVSLRYLTLFHRVNNVLAASKAKPFSECEYSMTSFPSVYGSKVPIGAKVVVFRSGVVQQATAIVMPICLGGRVGEYVLPVKEINWWPKASKNGGAK